MDRFVSDWRQSTTQRACGHKRYDDVAAASARCQAKTKPQDDLPSCWPRHSQVALCEPLACGVATEAARAAQAKACDVATKLGISEKDVEMIEAREWPLQDE